MNRKRPAKVVDLKAGKESAELQKATLYAEACARDEPSAEARAYADSILDRSPDEWRKHGELMREAMERGFKGFWLGYVTKASALRGAELLKQDLGFEDASPAERVLIDHAVLCHVRLGMMEHLYSRQSSQASYRMDVAEHYERRLTLAQRRFTRAVTALARVRSLLARAEIARAAASRASLRGSLSVLKQMTG